MAPRRLLLASVLLPVLFVLSNAAAQSDTTVTGSPISAPSPHTGDILNVAVTPDGQTIYSGGYDGTIKVWRLTTGEFVRTLQGHTACVTTIAFTADGRLVVSGSEDGTIRVWNMVQGTLMQTLLCHSAGVMSLAVAPDGRNVISGGADAGVSSGTVQAALWRWAIAAPLGVELGAERTKPPLFFLSQNTPNPFNPSTTLRFGLPEAGHVTLAVYDVNGRLVRNLAASRLEAGQHEVVWDGRDSNGREVASGVYMARLTAPQGVLTRRMVLVR